MRQARSPQAGFTLTELMVVVAIIAVLAAIAGPSLDTPADVASSARTVSSSIGEGARLAVSRGSVAPTVAAAESLTARTRITISQNPPHPVRLEVRVETGATTSGWQLVSQTTLARDLVIVGDDTAARISPGNTPIALTSNVVIDCQPSGQCRPTTLYIARGAASRNPHRIVVLPLAAAPQVLKGW